MKITIELDPVLAERLRAYAAMVGVPAEELARAAVADLIGHESNDFEAVASRVLEKNRELYRRLS